MKTNSEKIITIAVVAHVDHGKSTFSDRIIEICNNIKLEEDCILDSMDLEKERKVSIKLHPVRLKFSTNLYEDITLNLIDTPGHVDFSHEVSISLEICDIVFLLIDITQGVQAQTLSHAKHALKLGKKVIPIFNKIDMIDKCDKNISDSFHLLGMNSNCDFYFISARTGDGIKKLLEQELNSFFNNVKYIKNNNADSNNFSCKIIDSWVNKFLGIVSAVKVLNGKINLNESAFIHNKKLKIVKLGYIYLKRHLEDKETLKCEEIGFICSKLIDNNDCTIKLFKPGNIISNICSKDENLLLQKKCNCYYNIFPKNANDLENLKKALIEIQINDYGCNVEEISSKFFGNGFKCGFLGTFHAEIFFSRIKRISGDIFFISRPEVLYKIHGSNNLITSTSDIKLNQVCNLEVPYVNSDIIIPVHFYGETIKMIQNEIGHFIIKNTVFEDNFVFINLDIPLKEILEGLSCRIKSLTEGFGSISYSDYFFQKANVIKLDFSINDEIIEQLSIIDFKKKYKIIANDICTKLESNITRKQFKIVINCLLNGRKVLRKEIKPFRKDVTAKCYGGDVTRKNKLLKKQKKGKKKLLKTSNKNFIDKSQIINLTSINL